MIWHQAYSICAQVRKQVFDSILSLLLKPVGKSTTKTFCVRRYHSLSIDCPCKDHPLSEPANWFYDHRHFSLLSIRIQKIYQYRTREQIKCLNTFFSKLPEKLMINRSLFYQRVTEPIYEEEEQVDYAQQMTANKNQLNPIFDSTLTFSNPHVPTPPELPSLKPTQSASFNHNFQKHSVTTFKMLISIPKKINASSEEQLANKMWRIFKLSRVKSKKILVVLFGQADLTDINCIRLFHSNGFDKISCQNQQVLQGAQRILRDAAVEQLTFQNVAENVRSRKNLKMREQFILYFMEIMELLQAGPLVRLRMSEVSTRKIGEDIRRQKESEGLAVGKNEESKIVY